MGPPHKGSIRRPNVDDNVDGCGDGDDLYTIQVRKTAAGDLDVPVTHTSLGRNMQVTQNR